MPGLGTDEKIFEYLRLHAQLKPIPWKVPDPKDDMASYARRLFQDFNPQEPYAFLGVSFGGMLATELHHQCNPLFTVLVSSVQCSADLPMWMSSLRNNPFLWKMPDSFFKPPFNLVKKAVGIKNPRHQVYFKGFYENTSAQFFKRSMKIITGWQRKSVTKDNLIQIHGDKDKLFPVENMISPNYVLKGSHFLIISGAKGISEIINQEIAKRACVNN